MSDVALDVLLLAQIAQQGIECPPEAADFVIALDAELLMVIAPSRLLGRLGQFGDRPQNTPGQPPGHRQRQNQRHGAAKQNRVLNRLERRHRLVHGRQGQHTADRVARLAEQRRKACRVELRTERNIHARQGLALGQLLLDPILDAADGGFEQAGGSFIH
jgi:hypothetical protein